MNFKSSVTARHTGDHFTQAEFQVVMLGRLPVVLEGFGSRWLFGGADQRQITDFEQFRRCEKDHIHGVVEKRVTEASLIDD